MAKTVYRVIGFGTTEHGFFNQKAVFTNLKDACAEYDSLLHNEEMSGVVMIKSQHETWQVILEYGTENVSICCGPLFTFSVKQAPKLVFV